MPVKVKSRILYAICAAILVAVFAIGLCACNKEQSPYASDNAFEIEISDSEDALVFAPKGFSYTYGVIFYVGALVEPTYYSYLGEALAKQGYLAVFPKIDGNNAYNNYTESEPALEKYKKVKFFIAGHDFGGGAAVRRASENVGAIGVMLYAPLGFAKQKFDENGKLEYDDDGNVVWEHYSIAGLSIPTLLVETDDALRTEDLKLAATQHTDASSTEIVLLTNSDSISFSSIDAFSSLTEEQRSAQRENTLNHTLSFLKKVVCG